MEEAMKYGDDEIRRRLGLEMVEPDTAGQMLDSFYQMLDTRLSMVAAGRLTEAQLDKFSELQAAGDEEGIDALMKAAVPDYETLRDAEAGRLLQEIDDQAADMLKDL